MGVKNLQGWNLHHLSGLPVPLFYYPLSEENPSLSFQSLPNPSIVIVTIHSVKYLEWNLYFVEISVTVDRHSESYPIFRRLDLLVYSDIARSFYHDSYKWSSLKYLFCDPTMSPPNIHTVPLTQHCRYKEYKASHKSCLTNFLTKSTTYLLWQSIDNAIYPGLLYGYIWKQKREGAVGSLDIMI